MIVIDPRSLKVTVTWSLIALNNLKILVPRSNFEKARNMVQLEYILKIHLIEIY